MSEERQLTTAQKRWERLYAFIAISLLVMFAACAGFITLVELPLRLAFGWIWHLVQAVPGLLPQWPKLLLPLGCLALATWLVHRFIRWWLAAKGSALDWRAGHTLSATSLVLLGAAAAIALSGVVHQAVWLADAPWWHNGRSFNRIEAINKIRQLHVALVDFQAEHGRYPDSLEELDLKERKLLRQSPANGEPPEPMVYLKPREVPVSSEDDEGIAILVSPLLGSDREWVVVGFTSGAARSYLIQQLPGILETRREPSAKKR